MLNMIKPTRMIVAPELWRNKFHGWHKVMTPNIITNIDNSSSFLAYRPIYFLTAPKVTPRKR
jgi:hypothetical protein